MEFLSLWDLVLWTLEAIDMQYANEIIIVTQPHFWPGAAGQAKQKQGPRLEENIYNLFLVKSEEMKSILTYILYKYKNTTRNMIACICWAEVTF